MSDRETVLNLVRIKNKMDELIDFLGTDNDYRLFESSFTVSINPMDEESISIEMPVMAEYWELMEDFLKNASEILKDYVSDEDEKLLKDNFEMED